MSALKIVSDWKNYYRLLAEEGDQMNDLEIYQACAAVANNGMTRSEEKNLCSVAKKLLQIRRYLNNREIEKAHEQIITIRSKDLHPMLAGDRNYLLGVIHNRKGNMRLTIKNMKLSKDYFLNGKLEHRYLRAILSEKICEEDINSFTHGDLFAIKQKAYRNEYLDLVGNIQKGYSVQLLELGNYHEARNQALDAIESFKHDGCPEDKSIAYCIAAISSIICADQNAGDKYIQYVIGNSGKTREYKQIYNDLKQKKRPRIPKGHFLSKTKWPIIAVKEGTISGKILNALNNGKISRDDLITSVWGSNSYDISYISRLHVAINELRKKYKYNIAFNGTHYVLE